MVAYYTRSLPWHTWSVQGMHCRCVIRYITGTTNAAFEDKE